MEIRTAYSDIVRCHPWIGSQYAEQAERWLLLGESNYSEEPLDVKWLDELIQRQYGAGHDEAENGRYRMFAGAQRLVPGKDCVNDSNAKEFWSKVAFYNYVTECMPEASNRPTSAQFKQSQIAFEEVVCQLRPQVVLVLGLTTWSKLPGKKEGWIKGRELDITMPVNFASSRRLSVWQGHARQFAEYHIFDCFPVIHPSYRGFNARNWWPWINEAKNFIQARNTLAKA